MGFYSDLEAELRAKLVGIAVIGDVVEVRPDESDLLRLVVRKPGIGYAMIGIPREAKLVGIGARRQWQEVQWKVMGLAIDERGQEAGAPASQTLAESIYAAVHFQDSAYGVRSKYMFMTETFHGLDGGVTLVRQMYRLLTVRG